MMLSFGYVNTSKAFMLTFTNTDSLSYSIREYHRTSSSCKAKDTGCITVTLEYPTFSDTGAIDDSLNHYLKSFVLKAVRKKKHYLHPDSIYSELTRQYQDLLGNFSDYNIPWKLNRKASIIYRQGQVISLRMKEFSFTGGAHPNSITRIKSFGLGQERSLTLPDLVQSGKIPILTRKAERKFRTLKKLSSSEDLKDAGYWFDNDTFHLNQNFALTKNGLEFYYNNYEIAPYVEGATKLVIPYNELKGILNDKYLPK